MGNNLGKVSAAVSSLLLVAAVTASTMPASAATDARADAAGRAATFAAHGSVRQVYVTGATRQSRLVLIDRAGSVVARGRADSQGAFIFRDVHPGADYRVSQGAGRTRSPLLRVLDASETPTESFYGSQQLQDGYGYITTRDGTTLAVNVHLPGPAKNGPYPTVVEYSGYDPANPDSSQFASTLAQTLGYATVGVNMRGTGCSGGAWDYFEPLQSLDGYDAVEVVASQPWVLHGTVGMVGISYPGITQLFVAATRPPHLAAITPLSVIDDTYRGNVYPGGILNTGFAVPWAKGRQDDARPALAGGQEWAKRRIDKGDAKCRTNQTLRLQAPDALREIKREAFYEPSLLDHVNPDLFVNKIQVPTFIAGAWQDDQTGGHWPDILQHFSPATTVRATLTNGTHAEGFLPDIVTRWAEFLDFYVARRIPSIPAIARAAAPDEYRRVVGTPVTLPPDRFAGQSDFATTLAAYEAEPRVRVLFDNGAGTAVPGAPVAGFEHSFTSWPVPGTAPTAWYFGAKGQLTSQPPRLPGADSYVYDPTSVPATSHPSRGDDLQSAAPAYAWTTPPAGKALGYMTAPLAHDTVMIGPGSVDVWLQSNAKDVDLEVVITEVRPDGRETYVQSGWLRASHRALDASASTMLEPVQTHLRADAAPLPSGRSVLVRVPIFPFGHAFRAGSRVRVIIQAPGGNRPTWAFDDLPAHGTVTNTVARDPAHASRVVLPVVDNVDIPTPLPPCPSLRGEPCRTYTPIQEKP